MDKSKCVLISKYSDKCTLFISNKNTRKFESGRGIGGDITLHKFPKNHHTSGIDRKILVTSPK